VWAGLSCLALLGPLSRVWEQLFSLLRVAPLSPVQPGPLFPALPAAVPAPAVHEKLEAAGHRMWLPT
jgi:hypothetical protein